MISWAIEKLQRLTLRVSFLLHSILRKQKGRQKDQPKKWVVGVDEIASMLWRVHQAIPYSTSVALSEHSFYSYEYTFNAMPTKSSRLNYLYRIFFAPWLLGRLANTHYGFVYVGPSGFLYDSAGQREFEFAFLKKHGLKIVCYFTGDDIRSQILTKEIEDRLGFATVASANAEENPFFFTEEYERQKKQIAFVADRYADAIFSMSVEQVSHLKSRTHPFTYAYPDELFSGHFEKFKTLDPIKIVHAPSNQKLKGTGLVRQVIEQLRNDGRRLEYTELINVSNEEVLAALSESHIALNQFLAFTPGVFGIEAMAHGCVMLCSADQAIEPELAEGANEAWVVTRSDHLYKNLERLLDNPDQLEAQARRGFEWALQHESRSSAQKNLATVLKSI